MLFFNIFLFFGFSKKIIKKISSSTTVLSLPEFGFERNGQLHITAYCTNFSGIKLFILSSVARDIFYRPSNKNYFCSPNADFLFNYFRPTTIENLIGQWNIEFKEKNVYTLLLTNCENQKKIAVIVQYTNPNTYLDYRDHHIPYYFLLLSLIYLIYLVLWIINGVKHLTFHITIHYMFALSCLLKSISLISRANEWKQLQMNDAVNNVTSVTKEILKYINFTFLFSVNTLACLGINTFFDFSSSATSIECISIILVVSFLYVSFESLNSNYLLLNSIVPSLFLSTILFFVFIKLILNGINFAKSMFTIFDHYPNSGDIIQKANFILMFDYIFMCLISLYFSINLLVGVMSEFFTSSLKVALVEYTELLFYIVDMYYFMYRKLYMPNDEALAAVLEQRERDRNEEVMAANGDLRNIVVVFDEPNRSEISLFSNDLGSAV